MNTPKINFSNSVHFLGGRGNEERIFLLVILLRRDFFLLIQVQGPGERCHHKRPIQHKYAHRGAQLTRIQPGYPLEPGRQGA